MFLRRTERKKNGKTHHYWNVVENKRLDGGRVVQRHVLYLGEINSSQAAAWRKAIEVFDVDAGRARTLSLFPEDRCEAIAGDASVVQLRLSEMQLRRPRQWGACWLAGHLWQELQLDRFWADRLPRQLVGADGRPQCGADGVIVLGDRHRLRDRRLIDRIAMAMKERRSGDLIILAETVLDFIRANFSDFADELLDAPTPRLPGRPAEARARPAEPAFVAA